jgi:hypothetical protein
MGRRPHTLIQKPIVQKTLNFDAKRGRKVRVKGSKLAQKCKNKYLLFLESTRYIYSELYFSVNRRIGPPNPFCPVVV